LPVLLRADFFRFMLVFIMMVIGFSCSLFLLVQRTPDPAEFQGGSLGSMVQFLWFVALGDNLSDLTSTVGETESPGLTLLVYLAWVLVSSVLMLNLL
jgi:multisubunit Na+/H+ antiporter MnhB subunit